MEIKIQSIHFDATEKLQEFIEKKVAKLEKTFEDIKSAEVQLKVVKPATAQNKERQASRWQCRDRLCSWRRPATLSRRE